MTTKTFTLTPKETTLLAAIAEGGDSPGEGWLHAVAEENHVTAGVLGSLIKKGLATSFENAEPGLPTCYWVAITPDGSLALED
tara:strand:+ start:117 stop:365 length:249 start_codon:yes stop_codon:yes gene_type:complete